jgi:hypothetical protein
MMSLRVLRDSTCNHVCEQGRHYCLHVRAREHREEAYPNPKGGAYIANVTSVLWLISTRASKLA